MNIGYEINGITTNVEYFFDTNYKKLKKKKVAWKWNDLYFVLIEYIYNDYIKLKFFDKQLPDKYKGLFNDL